MKGQFALIPIDVAVLSQSTVLATGSIFSTRRYVPASTFMFDRFGLIPPPVTVPIITPFFGSAPPLLNHWKYEIPFSENCSTSAEEFPNENSDSKRTKIAMMKNAFIAIACRPQLAAMQEEG